MKAVRLLAWGHPVQLEDLPLPQPGEDRPSRSLRKVVLG
jgi:hypothetical protein